MLGTRTCGPQHSTAQYKQPAHALVDDVLGAALARGAAPAAAHAKEVKDVGRAAAAAAHALLHRLLAKLQLEIRWRE